MRIYIPAVVVTTTTVADDGRLMSEGVISYLPVAGEFELTIAPGEFTDSEIIVMLGENGTGKTTFIRMLAGRLHPDAGGKYWVGPLTQLFLVIG